MKPVEELLFVQHAVDVTLVTFKDIEILDEGHIKELQESILSIVEQAKRRDMLMDFCNIQYMSSAFLGLLVKIHKRISERGGKLELCNINPQIYKIFEITQLNKVFEIS